MKIIKIVLLPIFTILTLLLLIWNIAIPEETLISLIHDNAKGPYTQITFEEMKKGLFFNLNAQKVLVFYSSLQQPVLVFQDLKVNLSPLSLLTFKPTINLTMDEGDAHISGYFQLTGSRRFEINILNFKIEAQSGLRQFNIDGKGAINLNISGNIDGGEYKITANEIGIKPIQISGVLVPFDKFDSIKGIGNFKDKVIYVRSLNFSGAGIQALAKGSIAKNKSDITIEIITSKELPDYSLIDFALNMYKKSEGYYVVPMQTPIISSK